MNTPATVSYTHMGNTSIKPRRVSLKVSIKQCSLCLGNTEYYCHHCKGDLCRNCKETHVDVLDTKYHNVTVYRGKFNNSPRREMCPDHQDQVIEMYCEQCDLPVCLQCQKYKQYKLQNIREVYQNKRIEFNNISIRISCQSIYNAQVLLNELKSDFITSHQEVEKLKTAILAMSKRLKDSLNDVQSKISIKYNDALICRLLRQKTQLKRHIAKIQKYEHTYDYSAYRPIEFLRFIKTVCLPQIQDTPYLSQNCHLLLTQKINIKASE